MNYVKSYSENIIKENIHEKYTQSCFITSLVKTGNHFLLDTIQKGYDVKRPQYKKMDLRRTALYLGHYSGDLESKIPPLNKAVCTMAVSVKV